MTNLAECSRLLKMAGMLLLAGAYGCAVFSQPDHAVPDLPRDQLAYIAGTHHILAGPQLKETNVALESIDGRRVYSRSTHMAPGRRVITAVVFWGGTVGPTAQRERQTVSFEIDAEPGARYQVTAVLHGGTLLGSPQRYAWVENQRTREVIAGAKPPAGN